MASIEVKSQKELGPINPIAPSAVEAKLERLQSKQSTIDIPAAAINASRRVVGPESDFHSPVVHPPAFEANSIDQKKRPLSEAEIERRRIVGNFVEVHHDRIMGEALKVTEGNWDRAEELVQELYLKLLVTSTPVKKLAQLYGLAKRMLPQIAIDQNRRATAESRDVRKTCSIETLLQDNEDSDSEKDRLITGSVRSAEEEVNFNLTIMEEISNIKKLRYPTPLLLGLGYSWLEISLICNASVLQVKSEYFRWINRKKMKSA